MPTLRGSTSSLLLCSPFDDSSLHSAKEILFATMSYPWGQSFPFGESPQFSPSPQQVNGSFHHSPEAQLQYPVPVAPIEAAPAIDQNQSLFKRPFEPNQSFSRKPKRSLLEENKDKKLMERFPNMTQAILRPNLFPTIYLPDLYPSYKCQHPYYQRSKYGNRIKREYQSPPNCTFFSSYQSSSYSYQPFYFPQEAYNQPYNPCNQPWNQSNVPIDVLLRDAPNLPPSTSTEQNYLQTSALTSLHSQNEKPQL